MQIALYLYTQIQSVFFFSIRVFFHGHWQLTGQQGKGGDHLIPLYHFYPLTNIQTFICNFACEMNITFFKRNAFFTRLLHDEIYHLLELPFDWLIEDAVFVCLLDDLVLGFCYSNGSRWIWNRIDYHPCITCEPISQAC